MGGARAREGDRVRGFTLIELMVTIAVLAVIVMLALPSFREFSERAALRGAADNVIAVIADAKEESIKRDRLVNVQFKAVGTGFCVGAVVVPTATSIGCDCAVASSCPLSSFPGAQSQLRAVQLDGSPVFGAGTTDFVIDPKTGMLDDPGDTGNITLKVPTGSGVRVALNALGRPSLCTPDGAKALNGIGACP